jgi:hypothetical protein
VVIGGAAPLSALLAALLLATALGPMASRPSAARDRIIALAQTATGDLAPEAVHLLPSPARVVAVRSQPSRSFAANVLRSVLRLLVLVGGLTLAMLRWGLGRSRRDLGAVNALALVPSRRGPPALV